MTTPLQHKDSRLYQVLCAEHRAASCRVAAMTSYLKGDYQYAMYFQMDAYFEQDVANATKLPKGELHTYSHMWWYRMLA